MTTHEPFPPGPQEHAGPPMQHPMLPPRDARPLSYAAFWSVVLGALGLVVSPLALLGLPLALVGLGEVRRGVKRGFGLAVAGVVLNGIVWALWGYVLVSAVSRS